MSKVNGNPCIQERTRKYFANLFSSPIHAFFFFFGIFIIVFIALETLGLIGLIHPYTYYLNNLEYTEIRDLVDLLVTTDASILAFTGVISAFILKHIIELEREAKDIGYALMVGKNKAEAISNVYSKKRETILTFITVILISFILSILFGFGAIITQVFAFTILASLIFLFIGLIELVSLLAYSLG